MPHICNHSTSLSPGTAGNKHWFHRIIIGYARAILITKVAINAPKNVITLLVILFLFVFEINAGGTQNGYHQHTNNPSRRLAISYRWKAREFRLEELFGKEIVYQPNRNCPATDKSQDVHSVDFLVLTVLSFLTFMGGTISISPPANRNASTSFWSCSRSLSLAAVVGRCCSGSIIWFSKLEEWPHTRTRSSGASPVSNRRCSSSRCSLRQCPILR